MLGFCSKGARIPHGQTLTSRVHIRFHGVGGPTIGKVQKFDLGIIRRLSPDIIVLELGSNDLTKLPEQTVGSELETLVQYLHEFNVKIFAVCQVIQQHSPQCTAYNLKVTKLHLYLKAVLEPTPYCLYWKHRGLPRSQNERPHPLVPQVTWLRFQQRNKQLNP